MSAADWIAKRRDRDGKGQRLHHTDYGRALDALEKVLELHRENTPEDGSCQGYTDTGYGYLDSWCVECSGQSGLEYGTDFPCPTVATITEALTGGESDE